jgi:hypothetical protein
MRRSVSESAPIAAKITRDIKIEKIEKELNVWIEDQTQKKFR